MAVARMRDDDGSYIKMTPDLPPATRYVNDALHYAVQTNNKENVLMLINHGADLEKCCKIASLTPLQSALRLAHIGVFKLLLEHGAEATEFFEEMIMTESPDIPVWEVIRRHPEVLTYMFDNGVELGKHCSWKSWARFVRAIASVGNDVSVDLVRLFKVLLEYIPESNDDVQNVKLDGHVLAVNNDPRGALLFSAIENKSVDLVKMLVEDEGLPVNFLYPFRPRILLNEVVVHDHHTPLHHAARCGSLDIVKLLLGIGGKFVCCAGVSTPLDVAYKWRWSKIVKFFISNGFRSESTSKYKLHVACLLENKQHVQALIKAGTDLNQVDVTEFTNDGVTPLILSMQVGNLSMVKLLLKAGVEIKPVGHPYKWKNVRLRKHPIYHALKAKNVEILKCLLHAVFGKSSLKNKCPYSQHLLIEAANHSDFESFQLLLKRGADYEAHFEDMAPIHAAAKRGNLSILKAIVEKDVCVNQNAYDEKPKGMFDDLNCDSVDHRPLAYCRDVECIRYLLEHGANMHSLGIREHVHEVIEKSKMKYPLTNIVCPCQRRSIINDLIKENAANWDGSVEPCPPYIRLVESGNIAGLKAYFETEQGKTLFNAPYVLEQSCLVGNFDLVEFLLKLNPRWLMELEEFELLFQKNKADFYFGMDEEENEGKVHYQPALQIKMIDLLLNHGCTFGFNLKCTLSDDMDDLTMLDEDDESDGEVSGYDHECNYDTDEDESRELEAKDYAASMLNLTYSTQRFLCAKLLQEMCGRNLIIKSKKLLCAIMIDDDYDMMQLIRNCGHKIAGKSFFKLERMMTSEFYDMYEEFEKKADVIRREPLGLQSICRIKIRSELFSQMTEYHYINDLIQKLPVAKPILDYLSYAGQHEHSYMRYANDESFPVEPHRFCSIEDDSDGDGYCCDVNSKSFRIFSRGNTLKKPPSLNLLV
jgi:ankyrin repeat protein